MCEMIHEMGKLACASDVFCGMEFVADRFLVHRVAQHISLRKCRRMYNNKIMRFEFEVAFTVAGLSDCGVAELPRSRGDQTPGLEPPNAHDVVQYNTV